ncbi:hypothetical protein HII31_01572 [Pseudocercospora fuligena]|uniref:Mediator complex subunit 15 KIX domain-containing protein n=1 Tax=Pseudocercospora fuligena TaxID=685502 RepID=A0A8H6RTM8_9PEZI|nr:hypothetical protein HII31_01572 [Pseudocercospora fuligena]
MEQPNNMMGGGMPNMMNQGMQRPQSGNIQQQLHARIISDLRQNAPAFNGTWQATHDIRDRAQRIMQLVTQLRALNSDMNTCLNIAQKWEMRTFQEAQNKDDYVQRMDMKLKEIHGRRQQTMQNAPLGPQNPGMMQANQMSNANMMRPGGMMGGMPNMQNNAMNNMGSMGNMGNMNMNFQSGGMGMQQNQMNAGNPMFPAQLQRPMQASPVNLQNQPGTLDPSALMQQPQQQNQQQPPQNMGQQNQQPGSNMGQMRPNGLQPQIQAMAKRLYESMSEDNKTVARQRFLGSLNPVQRQQAQQRQQLTGQDPLMQFCMLKAGEQLRQKMAAINAQQNKPMMQMGNNMPQRPPSQTNGQAIDFSALLGQQANAVKSADAGEQVVPASNNSNNNANMGIGNQMNMPQNINPQMLANQGGQAGQAGQPNNVFNPQHLLSQQNAQEKERMQKQLMAQRQAMQAAQARTQQQQNQLQGQPGGLHAPNAFNGGPAGQANSPAMSMLNRPMIPPGQTTPGTPQPNRQQPTPQTPMNNANQQLMAHHQNMLNQNNQQQQQLGSGSAQLTPQQLQHLLSKVPAPFREKLQAMPQDQMVAVLNRFKNPNRAPGQPFPNPQAGQFGQAGPQGLPNVGMQNQAVPQMGNGMPNFNAQQGTPGQPNGAMSLDPQAAARQAQQNQLYKMKGQLVDTKPFPKQYQAALGLNLPPTVNTWMQLKQYVTQNSASLPQGTAHKIQVMQRKWMQDNDELISGEIQRMIQNRNAQQNQQQPQPQSHPQQNNAGQSQMSIPNQQAPPAQMVPPAPMVPPAQAGNPMMQPHLLPTNDEIQIFRQRIPQAAQMSDDDIRRAIHKRKVEQMRAHHLRQQQSQQNAQNAQQSNVQGPQAQRPNQQNQPNGTQAPQRTPQPSTSQPAQAGSQKISQQNSDDVVEISSMGGPPSEAMASKQPPQMPRMPNLTPQQLANMPDDFKKAYRERVQAESLRKAQGQIDTPPTQAAPNGQGPSQQQKNQELAERVSTLWGEVQRANPKGPAVSYDTPHMNMAKQSLAKLWKPLEAMGKTYLFAMSTGLEQRLREVMRAKVIVSQNASDENGTMKDYYSVSIEQLRELEKVVSAYMFELKAKQASAKQAGMVPNAMKQQQPPAPPMAPSTSQQTHNRKASVKAPPAPTENKTFDWAHPSPQGVPKYGQNQLTPDKLKFPPQKKRKTGQPDSQASTPAGQTGTPAATSASPALANGKIQSPEQVKKTQQQARLDAEREAQAKKFRCKDATREASLQGFDTEEQLAQHVQAQHQPIEDPLDFLVTNAAASLGVDVEGKPLPKTSAGFTKPAPASQKPRATAKDLNKQDLTKQEVDQIAKGIISSSVKDKIAKKQAEMDAAAKKASAGTKEQTMFEAMAEKLEIPLPVEPVVAGADVSDDFINWGPIDLGLNAMGLPCDGSMSLAEQGLPSDFGYGGLVPINPGMDPQDLIFSLMQEPKSDSDTSPELTPSEGSQSSRGSDVSQSDNMKLKIMIENEAADLWGTGEPGVVAQSMVPMYDRIVNMMNDGEDTTMGGVEGGKADGSPRKRKADEVWDLPLGDFMDDFWNGGMQS